MAVISKDSIIIELDIQGQAKVAEMEGQLSKLESKTSTTKGKFSDLGGAISKVSDTAMANMINQSKSLQDELNPMSIAIGKLSEKDLKKLDEIIGKTTDEFEILGKQAKFLQDRMKALGIEDKALSDSLIVADATAKKFGNTITEGATKTQSLSSKLKNTREELVRMEQAGQGGTKAFRDMQVQAGKLQDEIGDVKNSVRALASDTKNLDAGIGAIRGVVAGFTAYQGILGLVGGENKEFEKTLLKINGAMAVLQGLQEITNLLQADNVVRLVATSVAQNVWNTSLAGTNVLLGISTTETVALSGAMRGLQLAIAGTGIGLLVVGIGALAYQATKTFGEIQALKHAYTEYNKAVDELTKSSLKLLDAEKETALTRKGGINDANREVELLKAKGDAIDSINNAENKSLELQIKLSQERIKSIRALPVSGEGQKALRAEIQAYQDLLVQKQALNIAYEKQKKSIETKLRIEEAEYLEGENLTNWEKTLRQRIIIATLKYKEDVDTFIGTEDQKYRYSALRYKQYLKELEKIKADARTLIEIQPLETLTDVAGKQLKSISNQISKETKDSLAQLKKLANDFNEQLEKAKAKEREDKKKQKEDQRDLEIQGLNDIIEIEGLILDAKLNRIDAEINAQENKINRFRELAEFGTAEQLQLEEDRLAKLQKAREQEVEKSKKIAAIQIAINQAVSASETIKSITTAFGTDPTGITAVIKAVLIGATIASSLATVANAFGALPAFKGGTDYVQGGGTETSDSILARLSKGERVVPAHENKELRSIGVISNQDLVRYAKIGRALGDRNDLQPQQGKDYTDALNNLVAENRLMRKKLENLEIHMGISSEGVYGLITSMAERSNKLQKLKD